MNLTKEYYMQLKQVLRYVKGIRDYRIYFLKYADIGVDVWNDVMWIDNIDNRKLISVYFFCVGIMLVV